MGDLAKSMRAAAVELRLPPTSIFQVGVADDCDAAASALTDLAARLARAERKAHEYRVGWTQAEIDRNHAEAVADAARKYIAARETSPTDHATYSRSPDVAYAALVDACKETHETS